MFSVFKKKSGKKNIKYKCVLNIFLKKKKKYANDGVQSRYSFIFCCILTCKGESFGIIIFVFYLLCDKRMILLNR